MSFASFAIILVGVLLNAAAQLLLKAGTNAMPLGPRLAIEPHILGGLACYVISVVVWVIALSRVPVSIAYPMLSIGYVVNAFAAAVLFGEARSAARAIGDAVSDADAIDRIADIADDPPSGTTLVVAGNDDHTRGRYDGTARGLLRELEALGAIRSWGRFDLAADGCWQHRITVPAHRAKPARELVTRWLSLSNLDASLA